MKEKNKRKFLYILFVVVVLLLCILRAHQINKKYLSEFRLEEEYITQGQSAELYGNKILFKDAQILSGDAMDREIENNEELTKTRSIYDGKKILAIDIQENFKKPKDYSLNISNKKIGMYGFQNGRIIFLLNDEDLETFRKDRKAYVGNNSHLYKNLREKESYQTSLNDGEKRVILVLEYDKVKKQDK